MIDTHLNVFDSVVIGIMLLSCLFAFFRGLVKEILSLLGWIGAGIITVNYYPQAAEHLKDHFKNPAMAAGVAAAGLYIVALIGFAIINMIILKTIKQGGESGMLDNLLGLVFGALRGAFIVSLGFFLISTLISKDSYPDWIKESVTHTYAEKGALLLTRLAPESLKEISSLQKKAQEEYVHKKDRGSYSKDSPSSLDRATESEPEHE